MRRCLPLLPLCLLAASCGGAGGNASEQAARATMNEEQLSQVERRAPDPAKVMAERWGEMFAQPAATRAAASEFGFQLAPGKDSAEQVVPKPDAPIAVAAKMEVSGKAPERLESIRFAFDVAYNRPPKTKAEKDAEKVPNKIVGGFLNRFQVGLTNEQLGTMMAGGTLTSPAHGVTVQVAADPLPSERIGARRRIAITFTQDPAAAGMKS